MTAARARATDPWTSHAAAQSLLEDDLRESQRAVLYVLTRYAKKGIHDVGLIDLYEQVRDRDGLPMQSESGIRSRRAELVERGAVQRTGKTVVLESGRKALVWRPT